MPATQIPNPTGAFAPYFAQQSPEGFVYELYTAATAISAGMAVVAVTCATSVNPANIAVTFGSTATSIGAIGVALDAAATAGNTIRVVTKGIIGASCASAMTATSIASVGPSGQLAAVSATIGCNIAYCIAGNTAAGAVTVYVQKI